MSVVEWLSIPPSSVQIAPSSSQSVVSGSVTVTSLLPFGSTVMVHFWLLPWAFRFALVTLLLPLRVNALSRIRLNPALTFSLKAKSKVNSLPLCSSGMPLNAAVIGSGCGPATVAVTLRLSGCDGLPWLVSLHTAPVALQSVVAGSVTTTSSSPSGSMVIFQRSRRLSTRRASLTSPLVISKTWSSLTRYLVVTFWLNLSWNEKSSPSPSCEDGMFRNSAVSAVTSSSMIVPVPPDPPERLRKSRSWKSKFSRRSSTSSSMIGTVMVFAVSPLRNSAQPLVSV